MKRDPRRLPGVITVYLSLVLILVCALIFTLIESARVAGIRTHLKSITYMACDSVFAGFAEPVFDRYGVMLLWCSDGEFNEKFSYYANANLNRSYIGELIYTDIYGARFDEVSLQQISRPTDDGGQIFADQVFEYMNYFLAEDAARRILDNVSIFDQGGKVDAFMEKIESFGDTFKKVEDAVGKVRDKINKAKAIAKDPQILLDQAVEYLEAFADGDEDAATGFKKTITELEKTRNKLRNRLADVQDAVDTYYKCVEKAKEAVEELENALAVDKDEFDTEIYDAIDEQIRDIRQKSADTDFDYYLVGANDDLTSDYIDRLNNLDSLFEAANEDLDEENSDDITSLAEEYQLLFSDFSLDNLKVNFDDGTVPKEDDSFLSQITDFFNAGILGFVARDVSDKTIETEDLPSRTCMDSSLPDDQNENILNASINKAIYGEYILQHFGNCSNNDGNAPLDYEAEYILSGKPSDKDNLAAAVGEIVLIRTGCNLISLLKSTGKKAETYALASSLAGFTGMPIVIKIVQILVMAAWSLAESIADVKALIAGHKVRTIKDDDDWYISLAGIKNFGQDSINSEGNERGLTYEAYLRLLLLMQNRQNQYLRTMDLIQANMCDQENEDFRICDCICAASADAAYSAPHLFTTFPFTQTVLGTADGRYSFDICQDYSY